MGESDLYLGIIESEKTLEKKRLYACFRNLKKVMEGLTGKRYDI